MHELLTPTKDTKEVFHGTSNCGGKPLKFPSNFNQPVECTACSYKLDFMLFNASVLNRPSYFSLIVRRRCVFLGIVDEQSCLR